MKKYTEADILDFIEGRFNDNRVAQILAQKRVDPELADLIDTMQASQLPYKEAYAQQSLPDLPESLQESLRDLTSKQSKESAESYAVPTKVKAPYSAFATFLVVGLGLGFMAASLLPSFLAVQNGVDITSTEPTVAHQQIHEQWVQRVADYQSLYVENTLKSTHINAQERAHALLAELDTQQILEIPDLTEFGYEFARAQELGFEGETLLQFVYIKPGSLPLAYCVMPGSSTVDLPLLVDQQHQLGIASWKHQNQHNVIVADESPEMLRQIHSSILAI